MRLNAASPISKDIAPCVSMRNLLFMRLMIENIRLPNSRYQSKAVVGCTQQITQSCHPVASANTKHKDASVLKANRKAVCTAVDCNHKSIRSVCMCIGLCESPLS